MKDPRKEFEKARSRFSEKDKNNNKKSQGCLLPTLVIIVVIILLSLFVKYAVDNYTTIKQKTSTQTRPITVNQLQDS